MPDRAKLIAQFETLPAEAYESIHGLDDAQLDTPYRDGGWTARQVIHHLADSHMNAATRVRCALTEVNPTLKPYDQDAWATLPDMRMNTEVSLHILRGIHPRLAEVFRRLPDAAWSRTTFHPEMDKTLTVEDILVIYAGHGPHHLDQIRGLRKRMGW